MDTLSRLQTISLFSALKQDRERLEKIADLIKVEEFPPDTCIIKEGETGDTMYILNKGSVRVEKQTLSEDKFTVINLEDTMNIFFGEVALMDNDVRSASVFTITDVECFVLKKNDFEQLCEADPRIGYHVVKEIVKSLSSRLRKTTLDSVHLIAALVDFDGAI
jgi:CRP/FNR family transcriptional regulator, cyclic AMP receptor protein